MNHPHQQGPSASANHRCHCCPDSAWHEDLAVSRRGFLTTAAVGGAMLSGLSWTQLTQANEGGLPEPPPRTPLKVLPVLVWDHARRAPQRSWRSWGGIETPEQAADEVQRINGELAQIRQTADYPVEFLPLVSTNAASKVPAAAVEDADVVVVYGAGHNVDGCRHFGKDVILFQRHRSGPVYLQYEIVSPRFLRQHTDDLALDTIAFDDVVTDSLDELTWRLRISVRPEEHAFTQHPLHRRPGGWAQPAGVIPDLVKKVWNLDLQTVTYEDLEGLIKRRGSEPRRWHWPRSGRRVSGHPRHTTGNEAGVCRQLLPARPGVPSNLMAEADCRAITINGCMGTIMPIADTTACLTLSTLNDDGYLAFCESDFVVIPSGILLANISASRSFLNDPTYPHDGVITLAHCTGPRKMDGKTLEPRAIVTHFESDYGAAPKVEMREGPGRHQHRP